MNPRYAFPRDLAAQQIIPDGVYMDYPNDIDARSILKNMGVVLTDITWDSGFTSRGVPRLLRQAHFPSGWSIMKSVHGFYSSCGPAWYDLLDENNRVRARIKYTDHYGSRSAFVSLATRFNVEFLQRHYCFPRNKAVCHVIDEGQFGANRIIHTTTPIFRYSEEGMEFAPSAEDQAKAAAVQWLVEHYPDWRNPGAYWNQ